MAPFRAGILNVYPYDDDTLHFADGRLLLRGVNGSGGSTAMDTLLPFLLDADTRTIDAAGGETGVLRSWMLADTDETQRTGSLWIESARRDPDAPSGMRHHTIGCGIRTDRSTDRVTPWRFSTPKRPRIDFSLTAQRIPLPSMLCAPNWAPTPSSPPPPTTEHRSTSGASLAPTRRGTSPCSTRYSIRGR